MRAYLEYTKKTFQGNLAYRSNSLMGIVSTLISILVYVAIWKALYGNQSTIDGISFGMVVTNFVLGQAIANAFNPDDYIIASKVRDGSVVSILLKPLNMHLYVLAQNLGNTLFRILMQFIPSVFVASILVGLIGPSSLSAFLLFLVSLLLGFLVLSTISYLVSLTAFWTYNIFSIVTLKNVFISVLAGTLVPIWFLPRELVEAIRFTPLDSIFFIPISIYLGRISASEALWNIGRQLLWIVLLAGLAHLIWKAAIRKLVIQGG